WLLTDCCYGPAGRGRARTLPQHLLILRAPVRSKRSSVMPARLDDSDWIGAVDEQVLEGETTRQIIAQCLHAIALGGMMARGDEAHAILARTVEGLLRGFAGQVQVDPGRHSLVDVALPTTGAPADATDQPFALHQQRLTPEHLLHVAGEIDGAHGLGQRADEA